MKCDSLLIIFLSLALNSCRPDRGIPAMQTGNWIQRGEIRGIARSNAVSFVIDDIAYLGTGYNENVKGNRLNDFWKFSVDSGWIQVADFPGPPRSNAVGFSIDGYGYVGTGFDGINLYKDFYRYDPVADYWEQKASFIGSARYDAVGFGLHGKGYIATGYDFYWLNDNYQYDPATDYWVNAVSYSGNKRRGAIAFTYNNMAYLLTGSNSSGLVRDFWRFDPSAPAASQWMQLRDISNSNSANYDDQYADIMREYGVGFVQGKNAFLVLGRNAGFNNTTWLYDFENDLWQRRTAWERPGREGATAWVIKNRPFVATGSNGNSTLDDCDEFIPNLPFNPND